VLSSRCLLDRDGVVLADVACRHRAGRGGTVERTGHPTLVFVRRGSFVRHADGIRNLLDPTLAYLGSPGEEERYDHHDPFGDDCTALGLESGVLTSIWGGESALPSAPLPTSPAIDLHHRLLLAAARRRHDEDELVERSIRLAAQALETAHDASVHSGRPATERARRALVDGVRQTLASEPGHSLMDLARMLAVSPHHLSRVFHSLTGETISRYRMRLRARAALERLGDGETDLASLATDVGFADQSHLCRVLRAETTSTPSALRRALSRP
jgi:AraC-like DNA-binding protein